MCGHSRFASSSIMAALYARGRIGEGQPLDLALLNRKFALLANVGSNYLVFR